MTRDERRKRNIILSACLVIVAVCTFSLITTKGINLSADSRVCPTDVSIVVVTPERFADLLKDEPTTTTTAAITTTTSTEPPVSLNTFPPGSTTTTSTPRKAPSTTTPRKGP